MTPSPGRYVPDGPLDEGHIVRVQRPRSMIRALATDSALSRLSGAVAGGYAIYL